MDLSEYLRSTSVMDHDHVEVRALAEELGREGTSVEVAARCFYWVRDNIRHSADHGDPQVTVTASETLHHRTGLCYAKSHLLAAVLRANGIPCGLVYQRLATCDAGTAFCLHGLNAVWLPDFGWYRIDSRGDRPDVVTRFDPPREQLAFAPQMIGERLYDEVFADPLPAVIDSLRRYGTVQELCENLPDWPGRLG